MTINSLALALVAQTPVPRDLDLPLPLEGWALEIILVALFLLHIVFVNLMVGGTLLAVFFEILGRTFPRYDRLAQRITHTITVNKSLAVVLGVGPLLAISLLYTTPFYSANALTGHAWISIVPLVSLAFLLAYLYKYTWDRWQGPGKTSHMIVGGATALLFLMIPLIFLSNINLMLFPDKWLQVAGFFSSLGVGNVFPRYFHFLAASVAFTGFFLTWWLGRKSFPVAELLPQFTHSELKRLFFRIAFYVTCAQLVFGPLLLLTLPWEGVTYQLLLVIGIGVLFVFLGLGLLWREVRAYDQDLGRWYPWIAAVFVAVVSFMATGRQLYREACVGPQRQLVTQRTDAFASVLEATRMRLAAGLGAGEALASGPTGKSVFKNCAACHAVDKVLAAPALTEVYSLYKDNPEGIVAWAKNPGKKRDQFTQMPSFVHLGDEQLRMVADYILQLAAPEEAADPDAKT